MKKGMQNLIEVLTKQWPDKGFVCINNGDGDEIRDWPKDVEYPGDEFIEKLYDDFEPQRLQIEAEKSAFAKDLSDIRSNWKSWKDAKSEIDLVFTDEKQNAFMTKLIKLFFSKL